MVSEDYQLFGLELPFPRRDFLIALGTVVCFLPTVVIVHTIVVKLMNAVSSGEKREKNQ